MKCANFSRARMHFINYRYVFPNNELYVRIKKGDFLKEKLPLYIILHDMLHISIVVAWIVCDFLANECR